MAVFVTRDPTVKIVVPRELFMASQRIVNFCGRICLGKKRLVLNRFLCQRLIASVHEKCVIGNEVVKFEKYFISLREFVVTSGRHP